MASVSADSSTLRTISGLLSARPPRAVDQISVSTQLAFDETSLNFSYTQVETFDERKSRLLGLSAMRPFGENGNIFITAYKDLEDSQSYGVFAGLSWSFGGGVSGSAGMSSDADGYSLTPRSENPKSRPREVMAGACAARQVAMISHPFPAVTAAAPHAFRPASTNSTARHRPMRRSKDR